MEVNCERYFENLCHVSAIVVRIRISRRASYNEETNGENGEFLQFRCRRYMATIVKGTTSAGNGLSSALYFPRISFLIGGWPPWLTLNVPFRIQRLIGRKINWLKFECL